MKRLLASVVPVAVPRQPDAALDIVGLGVEIETASGPIRPVREVSLRIAAGETLALVGESGSGKSLTGLAILGLLPEAARVAAGSIRLAGEELVGLEERALRRHRGAQMAMIFQDPASSLNPVHRTGAQIAEAIRAHRPVGAAAAAREAAELLRRVGIAGPERVARAFPHELSGGMRQRVMIAIALANGPRLLVADEPTTALDVTIEAQVLDLLGDLQRERHLALLFITHSLPVVAEIADRVAVMYAGVVVEEGAVADIFAEPLHPYTAALLASVPGEAADAGLPVGIAGAVPLPQDLPPGCAFAPRCPRCAPACEERPPPLIEVAAGRRTRCLRWAEA